MILIKRRDVLATLGGAGLAGRLRGAAGRPIRLGGPIFLKSDDPHELAREHRRLGYSAAYCPMAKAGDSARVREIEKSHRTARWGLFVTSPLQSCAQWDGCSAADRRHIVCTSAGHLLGRR